MRADGARGSLSPERMGRAGASCGIDAKSRLRGAQVNRRRAMKGLGAAAMLAPFWQLLAPRRARALPADGKARRAIFFYFPDGVAGPSQDGSPSLWHAAGSA